MYIHVHLYIVNDVDNENLKQCPYEFDVDLCVQESVEVIGLFLVLMLSIIGKAKRTFCE